MRVSHVPTTYVIGDFTYNNHKVRQAKFRNKTPIFDSNGFVIIFQGKTKDLLYKGVSLNTKNQNLFQSIQIIRNNLGSEQKMLFNKSVLKGSAIDATYQYRLTV